MIKKSRCNTQRFVFMLVLITVLGLSTVANAALFSKKQTLTVNGPMVTQDDIRKQNMETVKEFYTYYKQDKEKFYSLWVDKEPRIVIPFVADVVSVLGDGMLVGWPAVKAFWDPIFDQMEGTFDWWIDEFIAGDDPDTIIVRTHSLVDLKTGPDFGNLHVKYPGKYLQIFRFENGKIKSFEEYIDTAVLNKAYSGEVVE